MIFHNISPCCYVNTICTLRAKNENYLSVVLRRIVLGRYPVSYSYDAMSCVSLLTSSVFVYCALGSCIVVEACR